MESEVPTVMETFLGNVTIVTMCVDGLSMGILLVIMQLGSPFVLVAGKTYTYRCLVLVAVLGNRLIQV